MFHRLETAYSLVYSISILNITLAYRTEKALGHELGQADIRVPSASSQGKLQSNASFHTAYGQKHLKIVI